MFNKTQSLHRLLPGHELHYKLSNYHAVLGGRVLLDSYLTILIHNPKKLLYQHAGSSSRSENHWRILEIVSARNLPKTTIVKFNCFHHFSLMASVYLHNNFPVLCTTTFTKILVILWDLIFLAGSTALLKAAILIIV